MTRLLTEERLKSDKGLQVERTTLSWIRTLFVGFLVVLAIIKKAMESGAWPLFFAAILSSILCIYVYVSLYVVASKQVQAKASRYKIIVVTLSGAAVLYAIDILW
ncbi:DUF202 domain-containing protein [Vibrio sp. E150_011]